MENRQPKWALTEAQKKVLENYKQAKKTHQTKDGTTTTIFFQGVKLETPRRTTQNDKQETLKRQDDWQRQLESISTHLKQWTTEPDSPMTTSQTTERDVPQESFYEFLRHAPDNYFTNPNEPIHPKWT